MIEENSEMTKIETGQSDPIFKIMEWTHLFLLINNNHHMRIAICPIAADPILILK